MRKVVSLTSIILFILLRVLLTSEENDEVNLYKEIFDAMNNPNISLILSGNLEGVPYRIFISNKGIILSSNMSPMFGEEDLTLAETSHRVLNIADLICMSDEASFYIREKISLNQIVSSQLNSKIDVKSFNIYLSTNNRGNQITLSEIRYNLFIKYRYRSFSVNYITGKEMTITEHHTIVPAGEIDEEIELEIKEFVLDLLQNPLSDVIREFEERQRNFNEILVAQLN